MSSAVIHLSNTPSANGSWSLIGIRHNYVQYRTIPLFEYIFRHRCPDQHHVMTIGHITPIQLRTEKCPYKSKTKDYLVEYKPLNQLAVPGSASSKMRVQKPIWVPYRLHPHSQEMRKFPSQDHQMLIPNSTHKCPYWELWIIPNAQSPWSLLDNSSVTLYRHNHVEIWKPGSCFDLRQNYDEESYSRT